LLLASLKRALNQHGFDAVLAASASQAKQILRRLRVDAMIIDLKLPDMSGLALITAARQLGAVGPVILFTAYPDRETAARAQQMGVRYVSKHEVRRVAALIELLHADIDADVRLKAIAEEQKAVFENLATGLETRKLADSAWREDTSLALVRVLVDARTPFPMFLAAAESFFRLMTSDATPREASAFMRVQAERCHARSGVVRKSSLQAIVESVEQSGPKWQSLRTNDDGVASLGDAETGQVLRAVGWSLDDVICGAALRRAVMLVAHTREHAAQIGYQLGFQQPPLFGRFFRRLLALAPGEFRALARRC